MPCIDDNAKNANPHVKTQSMKTKAQTKSTSVQQTVQTKNKLKNQETKTKKKNLSSSVHSTKQRTQIQSAERGRKEELRQFQIVIQDHSFTHIIYRSLTFLFIIVVLLSHI